MTNQAHNDDAALDWGKVASEHFVQLYDNDQALIRSISGFFSTALRGKEAIFLFATPEHRVEIEAQLTPAGFDLSSAAQRGQYRWLDAAEVVARIAPAGFPEKARFKNLLEPLLTEALQTHKHVRIYGEVVSLLWDNCSPEAALELEHFWNDLAKSHPFSLFCGYPKATWNSPHHRECFSEICNHHSLLVI